MYIRSKNNDIKQVTANFLGEQKSIEIIRSGGETLSDVRPLIRFNVSVMLEKNGRKETGVYGIGGRQSYDTYVVTTCKMQRWIGGDKHCITSELSDVVSISHQQT